MKTLKHTVGLLARRWRAWLGFEVLFHVFVICIVGPGLKLTVDGAMGILGYAYLTWENMPSFLLSPVVLVFLLAWLVVLTLAAVFNLAGLHYILAFSEEQERPRVQDAIRYALHRLRCSFRVANLPLVPYLLVLLPFVQVGTTAGVINTLELPEFIMEYVVMSPVLSGAYTVLLIVLAIVSLRFVFSTVYFVADDNLTFPQAARMSLAAGKGHFILDALRVLIVPILAVLIISILLFLPLLLVLMVNNDLYMALGVFASIFTLAGTFMSSAVSYATTYCSLLAHHDQVPAAPERPVPRMDAWVTPVVVAAVVAAATGGGAYFLQENIIEPSQVVQQMGSHEVQITAHRGGTFAAPENTMAAFEQAKRDGADVCEIDVQQSKDGVIFVSHDSNFSRVSGVDKGAWELTWAEIRELDATGSSWEGIYEKQPYPSLEEVVAWSKANGMQLNIELKPTGHETDFEKAVVDIVKAHDYAKQCVITSQVYETVSRVKEYDSSITCVYVMTLAYGEVWRMEAADAFSVEATNATPALVSALHKRGKEVYAWVVNSETSTNRMIVNGVDNVITDDVLFVRKVVDNEKELSPFERWLNTCAEILT